MAWKEMFFVQVFDVVGKRLVELQRFTLPSADEAKLKAARLSERRYGVVAFAQIVDDENGDVEEPKMLACYGRIPPEARAAAA